MLQGFYTAASGMLMQQRGMAVSSNNMANVKTPGFRTERMVSSVFEQALLTRQTGENKTTIGAGAPTRIVEDVPTNFDPSMLEETGYPFDMAIKGEGYFNVQGQNNRFVTRNGKFNIDEEGFLILPGVGRVLGENGPIQVGGSNFTVLPNGAVFNGENVNVGTLLITQPPEGQQLEKFANGLYVSPAVNNQTQLENAGVLQFTAERSNIDLNREFSMVMEMQRSFGACSTALKAIDQINQKTANNIASL